MKTLEYNRNNSFAGDEASRKRPIPHESAVDVQVSVATAVSQPSLQPLDRQARRAASRAFRREFGQFVAGECGVRYVREEHVYDLKTAEKVIPDRSELTGETVGVCREELRRGKVPGTCLDGIYHWLAVYGGLSEAEKAESEAGRDKNGGEW